MFLNPRGKAFSGLLILLSAHLTAQTPAPSQTPPPSAPAPASPPTPGRKPAPVRKPAKSVDTSFLRGAKLQIGEIVSLLRSVHAGRIKQSQLIEAIQSRGIAFPPSELNLARLMNSGAAEPVLEAIEKLNPPQPPSPAPAEPVKPGYTLVVTCAPAECETRVGDGEFRDTVGGKTTFLNLTAGRIILDAKKPGFETKTEIVSLDPTVLPSSGAFQHLITLSPTADTQSVWGSTLLASVLAKAKVPAGLATVSGTLTISDPASTEWKLTAHLSGSGADSVDLESAQGKVSYSSSAGFWQVRSSRKSPFRGSRDEKAKAEAALLRNIDMWSAFEYFALLNRLSKPGVAAKSHANPASNSGSAEMEIPTSQGSQVVTLNSDLQPSSIAAPSSSGANVPARVEFSDYRQMDAGIYPARTLIKFSDSEKHTLVLKADRFEAEKK